MIREFQSKGLMDYTRSFICIAFDHAIFGDPPPAPHRCPNTGNDGAKLDPDEFLASQIGNSGKNEDGAKVVEKRPKVTPSLVEDTRRSSSGKSDSASIDASAWTMDDGTITPQQLLRWSNMVRLGITDVTMLLFIERESVPHAKSVLLSIKKRNANSCMASTTTTANKAGSSSAGRGSIPQDCRNKKAPSRERRNGFEKIDRAIPPLCDDPNDR